MKRAVGMGLFLIFLFVSSYALNADAASVTILSSADEETEDVPTNIETEDVSTGLEEAGDQSENEMEAIETDDEGESEPSTRESTKIRWTYPVPLTALYSPYNKLVNRDNLLEESFEPEELIKMTVKRATSAAVYMEKTAGDALLAMFEAATLDGYKLFLKSGYRSYGTQKTTYTNRLQSNNGKDDGVVAYPGSSEHQSGLSCDILNEDYAGRPRMTTDFSETAEAKWMKENCAQFGFILRYPEGKTDITNIIFEPWHFRYVGKEVAGYIMRTEMTMEEFWDEWQAEVTRFIGVGGNVEEWMATESQQKQSGIPQSYVLDVYGEDGDAEVSLSF